MSKTNLKSIEQKSKKEGDSEEERKAFEEMQEMLQEKLEWMEEMVEEMEIKVGRIVTKNEAIEKAFNEKATEKSVSYLFEFLTNLKMANYFETICGALQKECGSRPYKNNAGNDSPLKSSYLSEDSIALKEAIDHTADKF